MSLVNEIPENVHQTDMSEMQEGIKNKESSKYVDKYRWKLVYIK